MENKLFVCGVPFDDLSRDELVKKIFILSKQKTVTVFTPNSEICEHALRNESFFRLLLSADVSVPDGAGVIMASHLLGKPIKSGKTAGVDLGIAVAKTASEIGYSIFILGGRKGVADKAAEHLKACFPRLIIAGTRDGYLPLCEASNIIAERQADIVFVCLGSPLQEEWIALNRSCGAKIFLALGGSVDIYSGNARRAPQFMINAGLEWLYRLIKQPKRFLRMLLIPRFLGRALMERMRGKFS